MFVLLIALSALVTSSEGERAFKQKQLFRKVASKKRSRIHSRALSKVHAKVKENDDHDDDDDDDAQDTDGTSSDAAGDNSADEAEASVGQGNAAATDESLALKAEESSEESSDVDVSGKRRSTEDEKEGDEQESDEQEEADSSRAETQKTKAEFEAAKLALLRNTEDMQHFKVMLRNMEDKAAQEREIQDNVDAVASQTQSKALAKFLGDMWKEMRLFAKPFYKEHLEEKLEDLNEAAPKLRKRFDEATSAWNKVKDEA